MPTRKKAPSRGRQVTKGGQATKRPRAGSARKKPIVPLSPKAWTVMVYMAGDNDLNSFCWKDLGELQQVGSNAHLNIIVQVDTIAAKKTRRYFVTKRGTRTGDVVQTIGEVNTGDPRAAIDFFTWAMKHYPAQRYLVGFWNHGSGIDETDVYEGTRAASPARSRGVRRLAAGRVRRSLFSTTRRAILSRSARAIAFDDSAKDFLDNKELRRVVETVAGEAGHPVDILGLDACLMAMLEVAYEMRHHARVVVGSQELEPGDGWPYHKVVGAIAKQPAITPEALGAIIVTEFVKSHTEVPVTQSATSTAQMTQLAEAVNALATALLAELAHDAGYAAIARASKDAQRFDTRDFVDLASFAVALITHRPGGELAAAAQRVRDLVRSPAVVLKHAKKGKDVKAAEGLSIYFPQLRPETDLDYARLDFARDTRWPEFLKAFCGYR